MKPASFLLTLTLLVLGVSLLRIQTKTLPPKIYLPPVLDLTQNKSVLGWDTDPITPTQIIDIANASRKTRNVPILHPHPKLMAAAQIRAEVMLKTQNVSHQDPFEGKNLAAVLPQSGYQFIYASENIALAQGNAAGIVAGFLNSPSHKINLLDPNLIETGVGIVKGRVGENFVVIVAHLFAIPRDLSPYQGYSVGNISYLEKARNFLSDQLSMSNPARAKIVKRQIEIIDQLKSLVDPSLPYREFQYDLLREYQENLILLDSI